MWSSGFELLDSYLGGGLRSGELTLLGGPQGLGKTTLALQLLRNIAAAGGSVIYFSFEHDDQTLLERLICIEAGSRLGSEAVTLRRVRQAMEESGGASGLAERLSGAPGAKEAIAAVSEWGDRVMFHRSNSSTTSVAVIREHALSMAQNDPPVVIVDYLQKVPVPGNQQDEEERVTIVAEGLKDLALEAGIPVLAVVAADREGLVAGRRLRIHHLRGSSALAYEADVALIMNNKYDVVARHHLVYDVGNAERFHEWVVVSIDKNRGGLDRVDLEFRKRFEQGRFEPEGHAVSEQLVDERVFVE